MTIRMAQPPTAATQDSRAASTRADCGSCSASPGQPCIGPDGEPIEGVHLTRVARAVIYGHVTARDFVVIVQSVMPAFDTGTVVLGGAQ